MNFDDLKTILGVMKTIMPPESREQVDSLLKLGEIAQTVLPKDAVQTKPLMEMLKRCHVEQTTYKGKKCVAIIIEKIPPAIETTAIKKADA